MTNNKVVVLHLHPNHPYQGTDAADQIKEIEDVRVVLLKVGDAGRGEVDRGAEIINSNI